MIPVKPEICVNVDCLFHTDWRRNDYQLWQTQISSISCHDENKVFVIDGEKNTNTLIIAQTVF